MRVEDLRDVVAALGAHRYLEKHAGWTGPVAVGVQLPSIISRAIQRGEGALHQLDAASMHQIDDAVAEKRAFSAPPWLSKAGQGVGAFLGKNIAGLGKPAATVGGLMAGGALAAFGKELGSMGAGLLRDIAAKAQSTIGSVATGAAQQAILQQIKAEDSVLAEADDQALMEAYHTMTRFAPTLSTDKNAVRSFLRQAVMNGTGPDYASIKLLADAEHAVTGKGKDDR